MGSEYNKILDEIQSMSGKLSTLEKGKESLIEKLELYHFEENIHRSSELKQITELTKALHEEQKQLWTQVTHLKEVLFDMDEKLLHIQGNPDPRLTVASSVLDSM